MEELDKKLWLEYIIVRIKDSDSKQKRQKQKEKNISVMLLIDDDKNILQKSMINAFQIGEYLSLIHI